MHPMAARVEPTVDGHSVSLSDVHHGWIGRGLAGLQGRVRIVVDRSLFGLDGLPVVGRSRGRTADVAFRDGLG